MGELVSSAWARVLGFTLALLSPMVLSIAGVLWKDIWCTAFIAIASASMLRQWSRGFEWPSTVVCVAALFLAILFRPNAIGAALAILAGLLSLSLKGVIDGAFLRRALSLIGAVPLSMALLYGGSVFHRAFTPAGVPAWSVYLFDIAGVVMGADDPAKVARHIERQYPAILRQPDQFHEMLADSFLLYSSETLNVEWGNPRSSFVLPMDATNTPQYKAARRELIQDYPAVYAAYRLEYVKYLLGTYVPPRAGRNGWVLADLRQPKNIRAASFVGRFENTWLMAPIVWFGVCLLAALMLLLPNKHGEGVGWMALGAVGTVAVLFFVGPARDYRYMFWPTVAGIVILYSALYAFVRLLGQQTFQRTQSDGAAR